jgi:hypothetical protein
MFVFICTKSSCRNGGMRAVSLLLRCQLLKASPEQERDTPADVQYLNTNAAVDAY